MLTKELEAGVFLKNLSNQQVVSNMLEARGNYYTRIKDYEKSLRDLTKVIELNPTNSEATYNLYNFYKYRKKDMTKAEQYLARCRQLGFNFDRKSEERDVKYMEYYIKMARLQGIDTSEIVDSKNEELARRKEMAAQPQMDWLNWEREHQELMKTNAANRKAMTKDQDQWRTKWEEQQKQMLADPTPRPGVGPASLPRTGAPVDHGTAPPDPNGPICPKCGKRH